MLASRNHASPQSDVGAAEPADQKSGRIPSTSNSPMACQVLALPQTLVSGREGGVGSGARPFQALDHIRLLELQQIRIPKH